MKFKKPRPLLQKTICVLGGMSNQATGEYYRLLNRKLNDRHRWMGQWRDHHCFSKFRKY
jgi:hypothetical protein